tara:strand:+ start:354 stop:524 length:171 start_codon:yes stop_codon:yes gene_type:complete
MKYQNKMEDIIQRLSVGIFGTWTSFSLQSFDAMASIICSGLVSVLTIISIYKLLKK